MDQVEEFKQLVESNIKGIGDDRAFLDLSNRWVKECIPHRYALNFTWLGRPIIQMPTDTYAMQELIWSVRPNVIIETGIAHGGSLVMSASILALIDYCEAVETGTVLDPKASARRVVGVDIDIRPHNRSAIEAHPLSHKIITIEGSSVAPDVIAQVKGHIREGDIVMVFLDSNHTHEHVLAELELYAPLVSMGSHCVVWDTGVEDLPEEMCADRPWGKGDNPKTAVWEYMKRLKSEGRTGSDGAPLNLEYDRVIEHKIAITASPDGFLKRV